MNQLSEQCVITQISFNLPAKKQGYLACISSGHPWGLLGRRFSLLVASRPLTKKRITYRFKLLMLNSFFLNEKNVWGFYLISSFVKIQTLSPQPTNGNNDLNLNLNYLKFFHTNFDFSGKMVIEFFLWFSLHLPFSFVPSSLNTHRQTNAIQKIIRKTYTHTQDIQSFN